MVHLDIYANNVNKIKKELNVGVRKYVKPPV